MSLAARVVDGAKVCVIPMPTNDDRPLALRHKPLALVSTLLIVAKVLAGSIVLLTPASADLSTITAARVVQLTNEERTKAGLSPLAVNNLLSTAAVQKGNHMLEEDYFAHISPSGVTPWFWMSKVGYNYQVAGENLAIDFIEAEDVVAAWLASPSHKDNMLHAQYTQTGVGVVTGEFEGGTSTIVVHMFGLPAGEQSVTPPSVTTPSPTPAVKATTNKSSPTPSPSPSPITPPPPADTSPPRVPRIAVSDPTVTNHVTLSVAGEPNTTAHFLVNNQAQGQVTLNNAGTAQHTLRLDDFLDGTIVVRAYGTDGAANQSDASAPLALTKDTQGPRLARSDVSFVVSPDASATTALVRFGSLSYQRATLEQNDQSRALGEGEVAVVNLASPLTLALTDHAGNRSVLEDIRLAPTFAMDSDQTYLAPPARFSQLARRLMATVFVTILILLLLCIMIRIRIQRPALIAHASLVLLLAASLFFW